MPDDVRFLSLQQILVIHANALATDGGDDGILKQDGLESAIAAPQATYGGEHLNAYPFEMAAAYIVGFTVNHAFVDGNKRVAAIAAAVFLELNGWRLTISTTAYSDLILAVARGESKKADVAQALRRASARVDAAPTHRTRRRPKRRR